MAAAEAALTGEQQSLLLRRLPLPREITADIEHRYLGPFTPGMLLSGKSEMVVWFTDAVIRTIALSEDGTIVGMLVLRDNGMLISLGMNVADGNTVFHLHLANQQESLEISPDNRNMVVYGNPAFAKLTRRSGHNFAFADITLATFSRDSSFLYGVRSRNIRKYQLPANVDNHPLISRNFDQPIQTCPKCVADNVYVFADDALVVLDGNLDIVQTFSLVGLSVQSIGSFMPSPDMQFWVGIIMDATIRAPVVVMFKLSNAIMSVVRQFERFAATPTDKITFVWLNYFCVGRGDYSPLPPSTTVYDVNRSEPVMTIPGISVSAFCNKRLFWHQGQNCYMRKIVTRVHWV